MLFDRVRYVIVLAHIKILASHIIFYCSSTNTFLTHVSIELFINRHFFFPLIYILTSLFLTTNSFDFSKILLKTLECILANVIFYYSYSILFFKFILFFTLLFLKRLHIPFFFVECFFAMFNNYVEFKT